MSSNNKIVSKLMDRYYPQNTEDALDAAFCNCARPGMMVLDAGCGGNRGLSDKAPLKEMHIVGVDIDSAVYDNPYCNETLVCDISKTLPFDEAVFDLIHCRWTLEHLEEPKKTFCEIARVLKPGGKFLALTPNIFHYSMIISRFTPFWFHRWWRRGNEGEVCDTFYRANSPAKLRFLCKYAGLNVQRLELFEGPPNYLVRFWPLFSMGIFYERIVNCAPFFSPMRHRIVLEAVLTPTIEPSFKS